MAKKAKKNQSRRLLTGLVKRHPDGFGFLIPDDPDAPDVYIPRHEMSGVMAGDRLEVELQREPGGQRFRGRVRAVLGRGLKRLTGIYEQRPDGRGYLPDHSLAWGSDLKVTNPEGLPVKPGNWVSVDVLSYPDDPEGFSGRLVAVIEDVLNPLNDNIRVIHSFQIPHEFSDGALAEARRLPPEVHPQDWQDRKDLRNLGFVTIDGKTAKDFDDAIYVESREFGFKLWVAIADVSHYVKPGTRIDEDAYERGTSTYFPNFVSPMLPEALSNELCSLKPRVPRLAFVAEMDLNFQGELRQTEIYEAVIESKARVTYGEAQEIIDGVIPGALNHVAPMIKKAEGLAKILMARRFKEGSLDLELPETTIEVDDAGQPVDIMQSERLFSHRLIEEMMLMANVAVAKVFRERSVAGLYRIHEEPNPQAVAALEEFLALLGSKKRLQGGGLQKKITRALSEFSGHAQAHILNVLTLRSMAQARYSANNVGHFGLGFSDYAHFTSPIRRYPDLLVHRQLKALLYPRKGYHLMGEADLEAAGTFLSACEQRSVKAERQIHAIKKARFMSQHLGQEFEGMVTSVTKFGLFIQLRLYDVDGLLRIEELPGDRFEFDEENMRLVGRRSGRSIAVGDMMAVIVAAASPEEGRIDFLPSEEDGRDHQHSPKKQSPQKRR